MLPFSSVATELDELEALAMRTATAFDGFAEANAIEPFATSAGTTDATVVVVDTGVTVTVVDDALGVNTAISFELPITE